MGGVQSGWLRDSVLSATASCVDEVGWSNTTIERIARKASMSPAAVREHYSSREHLTIAIFQRLIERLAVDLADECDDESPLVDKLTAVLTIELRLLEPHKRFVQQTLVQFANPLSPLMSMQGSVVRLYSSLITDLITEARVRGEISQYALPSLAAGAFLALRLQVIAAWLRDSTVASEATHARVLRWVERYVGLMRLSSLGRLVRSGSRRFRKSFFDDIAPPTPAPPTSAQEVAVEPVAPPRPTMVLEGKLQEHPNGAFLVENTAPTTIVARMSASVFVSAAGKTVSPPLTFEPPSVSLESGQEALIQVSAEITPDLDEDVAYRGELSVVGLPGTTVAIVVRRLSEGNAG